ncbi:RagB/SusD domain-containing protein [Phocaeicola salanitronis DSM 18170]|uniref:RagB/SusD domain-containing protein n=1 Tax=Phocaeicola salanitronis (strain DSM 18170 / JCM 13657 / CCUG 60908 / BL78) TaxID=667015 RepID=F0R438_PHOSB|nr:RagB/SusD family nutrient uptake outer membrane protein [Phocaeicola salanitronis]ADY36654.1 RagB/SusD domain-containing protein [Phocaeicola salanitronis DSM 18170]
MKTKVYLSTLLLALMAVLMTGCEDRLNIYKHGSLGGPENYYKTDEETESALAAMYGSWRDLHQNWFTLLNGMSDDAWAGGGQRNDNVDLEKMNEFNYNIESSTVQSLYTQLYTLIYRANLILSNVPGDTQFMRQAIAEAHAARGWAHFYLVTLWGTAPIVDHLLSPDEYRQSNGTPETTWAFIESEYKAALDANALTTKSGVDDTESGIHLTQETVKAFLGKAYLFQGKYAEAADILDEVINSGKYDLYRGDYGLLGHAATNNCCEAIFEINRVNNTEQAWNQFSQLFINIGWRSSILSYMPGTESAELIATGSYGMLNPQKGLYDAFVAEEGVDGYRLNQSIRTYEQLNAIGVVNTSGSPLVGNEGYFYWKTRLLKDDCITDNPGLQMLQWNNLRIMRYAEVLLMAAEAHVQGGVETDKALTYINLVRERAHLNPLTAVTMDDIKNEKRLELCLESCRYQDLVRWGDAETVLGQQGKQIPSFSWSVTTNPDGTTSIAKHELTYPYTNTDYGFKERNKLLPIPLREMDVNPNMQQNPGW